MIGARSMTEKEPIIQKRINLYNTLKNSSFLSLDRGIYLDF